MASDIEGRNTRAQYEDDGGEMGGTEISMEDSDGKTAILLEVRMP
jgi:hypothetical protein